MTILKSNKSNDKLQFEIKKDYVLLEICMLENKKEISRLGKFLIIQLEKKNCKLPICIKSNQYLIPEGLHLEIKKENLPKKDKKRFILIIPQEYFYTYLLHNLGSLPWSTFDYNLDKHNYETDYMKDVTSPNKLNSIKIDTYTHPYGIIFYLDYLNRPDDTIKLIEIILDKTKEINKPFKLRMYNYEIPEGMEIYTYNNPKDILIKASDFIKFFKFNINIFISNTKLKYIEENIQEEIDDDGFTTHVDKKKVKRNNIIKEKEIINQQVSKILEKF